jgi:type I restriction enzyme R subunit
MLSWGQDGRAHKRKRLHVESVHDEVEALVMDAEVLEEILKNSEPEKKAREIEIKISARLRKHAENPKFKALGERLEQIKEVENSLNTDNAF